jgi:hypothetical protein
MVVGVPTIVMNYSHAVAGHHAAASAHVEGHRTAGFALQTVANPHDACSTELQHLCIYMY